MEDIHLLNAIGRDAMIRTLTTITLTLLITLGLSQTFFLWGHFVFNLYDRMPLRTGWSCSEIGDEFDVLDAEYEDCDSSIANLSIVQIWILDQLGKRGWFVTTDPNFDQKTALSPGTIIISELTCEEVWDLEEDTNHVFHSESSRCES